ncbi:MAG: hypothetical protein H6Q10_2840 [Acidobacteria bacterium]|nr:hypothetical protein [Acidobacteriota bacterium]
MATSVNTRLIAPVITMLNRMSEVPYPAVR